jgi:hypothetical protein
MLTWQVLEILKLTSSWSRKQVDEGRVYVRGHSMGAVVAGQALRLAGTTQIVNTYVASQGALSAHTYDSSLPDALFTSTSPDTPNIYQDWFAYNNSAAGRRINFYNVNDFALKDANWGLNQRLKPDTSVTSLGWTYIFDGSPYDEQQSYTPGAPDDTPPWLYFLKKKLNETRYFDLSIMTGPLADRYEVMAHAAESRATALGKTPGVANLTRNVDLQLLWPPDVENPNNPYSAHKWHSPQFRSTNMKQHGYWETLLFSVNGFNLPNP